MVENLPMKIAFLFHQSGYSQDISLHLQNV